MTDQCLIADRGALSNDVGGARSQSGESESSSGGECETLDYYCINGYQRSTGVRAGDWRMWWRVSGEGEGEGEGERCVEGDVEVEVEG